MYLVPFFFSCLIVTHYSSSFHFSLYLLLSPFLPSFFLAVCPYACLSAHPFIHPSICRVFIKFLCWRLVGFFSWAFLVFLKKESKKRRRKQPGKVMAKSCSQPVNLQGAWPLISPLHLSFYQSLSFFSPSFYSSTSPTCLSLKLDNISQYISDHHSFYRTCLSIPLWIILASILAIFFGLPTVPVFELGWHEWLWFMFNAVKCNLTELTTKSACIPLVVSGVNTCAHVLEFHELVDRSVAYLQEAFFWWFCSGSPSPRQFPSHPFSLGPLSTVSTVSQMPVSSYCVGAHCWVARFNSHGSSLHIEAGSQ